MAFLKRLSGGIASLLNPLAKPYTSRQASDNQEANTQDSAQKRKRQDYAKTPPYKRRKLSRSPAGATDAAVNGHIDREETEADKSWTPNKDSDYGSQINDIATTESSYQHELNEASFISDVDEEVEENVKPANQPVEGLRRVPVIPPDGAVEQFSPDEFRAAGWDESHIRLASHLARRGHEAIIPKSWKQGLPFIPEALFIADDLSVLLPHRHRVGKGEIMFEQLIHMGGHIRAQFERREGRAPQQIAQRFLKQYMRWTLIDSNLHKRRTLPIVTLVIADRDMEDRAVVDRAAMALHRLSEKYKQAFQARQSTEIISSTPRNTPASVTFHNVPTLYALMASNAVVALAALKPDGSRIQSSAFFDFSNSDHDFWNTLALALIMSHGRDMQIQIAEETGLGCKLPDDLPESDPDA